MNAIKENLAILVIHCPDQKGIVAAVTEFIAKNNGNIIDLDQHVDTEEKIFFMRVSWDISTFSIPKEKIEEYFRTLLADKMQMSFKIYLSDQKPKMAIFVSKISHCLYDLLSRHSLKELDVEIPLIISNHENMRHVAEKFDIPYYCFPITKENKKEQEEKELKILQDNNIDFIVLARYMQIISENMIKDYTNKIINIHHSFLPAFPGAKPYHSAHKRGVKIIGATSHYVTEELDAGPIIEQDVARITHRDSIADLVRKGRDLEKVILARAVWLHTNRKILTYKNKTVIFD